MKLPIFRLALVLLASSGVVHAQDPARFESEIRKLEALPRPLFGVRPVVFAGSSSFRMWTNLTADMKGVTVVNCGFGGSHMSDLVHFAPRIVLPFRPKHVIVYEGDNDLAANKTPAAVFRDYEAFVARVHRDRPEARISFVSVKPSPSRRKLLEAQRELNRLLREYAKTDRRLGYIDVFTPMLDDQGEPRPELFGPDKLHLNSRGYDLWTGAVRAYLGAPAIGR